ncbi:uncharacterized protein [Haliotis cracherodii]|uniref:uncharacterized protein n=1 Tax=Haliotis cracherodii TaxID=6455 RepID=UPI0039EB89F5
MNMESVTDMDVDVSLAAVENHLSFLELVDNRGHLYEGPVLLRAIGHYERYWLPFASKHPIEVLAAPLDIEWVWHCHMLAPMSNQKDCLSIVGVLVPHKLIGSYERQKYLSMTEYLWNKECPETSFHAKTEGSTGEKDLVSSISYDLVSASARQKQFFYQVSLPHYKHRTYLQTAMKRYKQFLFLLKSNPNSFLAPTFDIDLVWHTHQLDPVAYLSDTKRLLGKILSHDDSVNDRSQNSKLTNATMRTSSLWKNVFHESFSFPGAMYRGENQKGQLYQLTEGETKALGVEEVLVKLTHLEIDGLPTGARSAKLEVAILRDEVVLLNKITLSTKNYIDKCILTWKGANLFQAKICTNKYHVIHFKLIGKSGFTIFKKEIEVGEATLDCLSSIETVEGYTYSISAKKTLEPWDIILTCKGELSRPVTTLQLNNGPWKTHREGPLLPREEVWGPVPIPRPVGVSAMFHMAIHKLTAAGCTAEFVCRVVHSTDLLMSAVLVYHQQRVVTFAYLIGADQLPTPEAVDSSSDLPSINPKLGQRAMLIQNNKGDWGLVTGNWVSASSCSKRRKKRQDLCGYLNINFYKFSTRTMKNTCMCQDLPWKFYLRLDGMECRRKCVTFTDKYQEAAERVTLAFSVSVLHVLCQPRSKAWKTALSPNYGRKLGRGVLADACENVLFLSAAGVLQECLSNHYLENSYRDDRKARIHALFKKGQKKSGQGADSESGEDEEEKEHDDGDDELTGDVNVDLFDAGHDEDFEDPCMMGMDSFTVDCSESYDDGGDSGANDYGEGGCDYGGGSDYIGSSSCGGGGSGDSAGYDGGGCGGGGGGECGGGGGGGGCGGGGGDD